MSDIFQIKLLYACEHQRMVVFEAKRTDLPADAPKSAVYQWFVWRRYGGLTPLTFQSWQGDERAFAQGRLVIPSDDPIKATWTDDGRSDGPVALVRKDPTSQQCSQQPFFAYARQHYARLMGEVCTWTRIPSGLLSFQIKDGSAVWVAEFERDTLRAGQPLCYYSGASLDALEFGSEFSHGQWGCSNYSTFQNKVTIHHAYETGPPDTIQWTDGKTYKLNVLNRFQALTVPQVASFPIYEHMLLEMKEEDEHAPLRHLTNQGVLDAAASSHDDK